jgi:hypothetical protein
LEQKSKMKNISTYGIVLILAISLTACEYNVENEDMIIIDDACDPAVLYSTTIAPLIANNCMPCHNGDGSIPQAPNLTIYSSVQSNAELIKEVTQSRRMPKNGTLTNAEIAAIKCWVDNDALDN